MGIREFKCGTIGKMEWNESRIRREMSTRYRLMAVTDFTEFLTGEDADWYETEKNTAALLQAVVSFRSQDELSSEDLYGTC